MPDTTVSPATDARREADYYARAARLLLRLAAKHLDGLRGIAHHHAVTALTAIDDTLDAIEAAQDLDAQIEAMEKALEAERTAEQLRRDYREERGIAEGSGL